MSADDQGKYYNPKFYRELSSAQESAREILPLVLDVVKPASLIDIGCGTGNWLAIAYELGVHEILGIDGAWVKGQLAIPPQNFLEHDLSTPLKLNCRFDLALSLEVAEHLPASAARDFVQSLCEAADVVLFSAAIPGQGGRRHVNEQWPAYWAELFADLRYECYDFLRPRIWNNPRVTWHYAQNSMIFARAGSRYSFGEPTTPLPLIHPVLWSSQVARMKNPGKLLESLPKAILASIKLKKTRD
ncbi:MAG TPA: methyltransferase domain-containing protein [Terriglobales bacterium]|jgi:SAM-dependent methyltransferase|nr:methyltransferase domain-containing protein [Terriglobales bacterium]